MALKLNNEIKTGILGIVALTLTILGFKFLKGSGMFSSNHTMYAKFANTDGLTPSSYVRYMGVNVGSVKEIAIKGKDEVEVAFSLQNDLKLPKDTKVFIEADGLLGGKVLRILPGNSTEFLKNNDILQSDVKVGLMDNLSGKAGPVVDKLDTVMAKLGTTVDEAKNALASVNGTVNNFNSALDASTKAKLQNSIAGLDKSVADFNILSAKLALQGAKIDATMSSVQAFSSNLNTNNAAINSTLKNVENITSNVKTTTNKLNEAELTQTISSLKSTIDNLNATLAKVNKTDGSIGLLMNDAKLYNNLQGSLHSLDALLADLKAHPSRYISVSVFGKKQKELPLPDKPNN